MKLNLTLLLLLVVSNTAFGWGQTGHRTTGAIAEHYLSTDAKLAIDKLLPNESLAEASTYADEMRSDPSVFWQKTASPWHYVTVPAGKSYSEAGSPSQGDAVTALKRFRATLRDKNASLADKRLALRFTIHLVGDLHQPLHAGNGTDRGGNTIKLTYFGEPSNLHTVWDSAMIDGQNLSYSEWSQWLQVKITKQQTTLWAEPDPLVWIAESAKIRDTIYPQSDVLMWDYGYQHLPTVKTRLQQAGVRLAAYLNAVFAK